MSKKIRIAIDGPAASGKSTTARLLAQRMGYLYIDTGAMYRAATLCLLREGVDIHDPISVVDCLRQHRIDLRLEEGTQKMFLDGEDVTPLLRSPQINQTISIISSYPQVRERLVQQQRELAREGGVVMDGRDIGTVVLPDAELKVFLVASLEERARRRQIDLERQGIQMDLEQIKEEIARRDRLDSQREQSPLKKAPDARELDTTHLNIEEQVETIYKWSLELIKDK